MEHTEQRHPTTSPWGIPNSVERIAEGIYFYSTPSHGGYWISKARMNCMHPMYKLCSFTSDCWFEEDCSWVGVVLSWPPLFDHEAVTIAHDIFNNHYAKRSA